jgi:hypothetical protein
MIRGAGQFLIVFIRSAHLACARVFGAALNLHRSFYFSLDENEVFAHHRCFDRLDQRLACS